MTKLKVGDKVRWQGDILLGWGIITKVTKDSYTVKNECKESAKHNGEIMVWSREFEKTEAWDHFGLHNTIAYVFVYWANYTTREAIECFNFLKDK